MLLLDAKPNVWVSTPQAQRGRTEKIPYPVISDFIGFSVRPKDAKHANAMTRKMLREESMVSGCVGLRIEIFTAVSLWDNFVSQVP